MGDTFSKKVLLLVLLVLLNVFLIGSLINKNFSKKSQGQAAQATTQSSVAQTALKSVTPACAIDPDCRKDGKIGTCENPSSADAKCIYSEDLKLSMLVVVPGNCRTCNTGAVIEKIQGIFPKIEVETVSVDDARAKPILELFKVKMLPAYFLSKTVEKEKNFNEFNQAAFQAGDWYYLKPSISGVSYFLDRPVRESKLDVFFSLLSRDASRILAFIQEVKDLSKGNIQLQLHLVGFDDPINGGVLGPYGLRDVEEGRIFACVEKSYPDKALDYLIARVGNIESIWWEDALQKMGGEAKKIHDCARSLVGQQAFDEKIKVSKELGIFNPSLFLLNNVEIFGISGQTTAAEILKILESQP